MQKGCRIAEEKDSRQALKRRLGGRPEALLEAPGLVEGSRLAVEEAVSQPGRAAVEALLEGPARSVAWPRRQGRRGEGKGAEAAVPALGAINGREGPGRRILGILMRGVFSRSCAEVIDGNGLGGRQAICAAGRPRLFVAVASAALGRGVQEAFGAGRFVQRCRMCEPQRGGAKPEGGSGAVAGRQPAGAALLPAPLPGHGPRPAEAGGLAAKGVPGRPAGLGQAALPPRSARIGEKPLNLERRGPRCKKNTRLWRQRTAAKR